MEPMKPMKGMAPMKPMEPISAPDNSWWPAGLSDPSSTGGQNGARYAFFPAQRRLAVEQGGRVRQYDTGSHRISGVSQQQQSAEGGAPTFASQDGPVDLASLKEVG
jgi:hypothetical protein